jgi:hypothetical protein
MLGPRRTQRPRAGSRASLKAIGYILALAVFVAIGFGGYFLVVAPKRVAATPADILKHYGYLEIRPASLLNGPGTIDHIDKITDNYVMLHLACKMDMDELKAAWEESRTLDANLTQQLQGNFKLAGAILESIKSDIGFDKVEDVSVSFSNTNIVQLDDETTDKFRLKYLAGDCGGVIKRSYPKTCITQPYEVLRSDIIYLISYKQNLSAEEKAKLNTKLAPILSDSVSLDRNDSNKITGQNVFIGIKLSEVCIVPNEPDAKVLTVESFIQHKNANVE